MSELPDQISGKVTGDMDPFKQILAKIPGFGGYIERQSRRDADKLLRETIASRVDEQHQRVSGLQRDFISNREIAYVDDLEAAAIKLRTFGDRVRRATRGYSGLFDAVKINETELAQIYQYDAAMLEMVDEVERAIDNVEMSVGTDGLEAAIRNLVSNCRQLDVVYDKREEVIFSVT